VVHVARVGVGAGLLLERDEQVAVGVGPEPADERPAAELALVAVDDAMSRAAHLRGRGEAPQPGLNLAHRDSVPQAATPARRRRANFTPRNTAMRGDAALVRPGSGHGYWSARRSTIMTKPGMRVSRRAILATLTAVLVAGVVPDAARAQEWPTKPVTIVVPYGPGASNDTLTRALAQVLTKQLGQSFVVVNRPGAGGFIGSQSVAKAAPDGYTFLEMPSSIAASSRS
jgi:hypothetical protein